MLSTPATSKVGENARATRGELRIAHTSDDRQCSERVQEPQGEKDVDARVRGDVAVVIPLVRIIRAVTLRRIVVGMVRVRRIEAVEARVGRRFSWTSWPTIGTPDTAGVSDPRGRGGVDPPPGIRGSLTPDRRCRRGSGGPSIRRRPCHVSWSWPCVVP